ncbi:MAG: hypothetical protein IJX51_05165 [Clostridia bacterium]|nr:hypothetical protein [Clostridia bacterium]
MSENKNINIEAAVEEPKKIRFTIEYVLEKIEELTKQLESVESVAKCISIVSDEIDTDEPEIAEHWSEVCSIKAAAIREVFTQREANLKKLLDYYIKLYDDIRKNDTEWKADLIKNTFSELSSKIGELGMDSEDMLDVVNNITEATKNLLSQLMLGII